MEPKGPKLPETVTLTREMVVAAMKAVEHGGSRPTTCPLAQAVRPHLPDGYGVSVGPDWITIFLIGKSYIPLDMCSPSADAMEVIRGFDRLMSGWEYDERGRSKKGPVEREHDVVEALLYGLPSRDIRLCKG